MFTKELFSFSIRSRFYSEFSYKSHDLPHPYRNKQCAMFLEIQFWVCQTNQTLVYFNEEQIASIVHPEKQFNKIFPSELRILKDLDVRPHVQGNKSYIPRPAFFRSLPVFDFRISINSLNFIVAIWINLYMLGFQSKHRIDLFSDKDVCLFCGLQLLVHFDDA